MLAKYLNPILLPLTSNEFNVKNYFDFDEEVVNYDHIRIAWILSRYLQTFLWIKILKTVSMIYSRINFIAVN